VRGYRDLETVASTGGERISQRLDADLGHDMRALFDGVVR